MRSIIRPLASQDTQTHNIADRTSRNPLKGAQCRAAASVRPVEMSVSPIAYLRAAQAYMLISMPTGTSTIFGVFQAILALLQSGTNSTLAYKVARNKKFASEIFAISRHNPWRVLLRCKLSVAAWTPSQPNQNRINNITAFCHGPVASPEVKSAESPE